MVAPAAVPGVLCAHAQADKTVWDAVCGSVIRFGPEEQYGAYVACPSGTGPFPALVVIHEWWGLNDHIKEQSNKLAHAGYIAMAVDLFGATTTDPEVALSTVQNLDQQAATQELLAASHFLRSQPNVVSGKVGAIGWCFGGGQALRLAMADPELAAAVIYYGQPILDPDELRPIKAALLGIYGEADEMIPILRVSEFGEALLAARVRNEFYTYPGAAHAFANPSRGKDYNPEAAADAWHRTLAFLHTTLGGGNE